MFTMKIDTSNDAFSDDQNTEVARILHDIAAKIESGFLSGCCRDTNGNAVGEFYLRLSQPNH